MRHAFRARSAAVGALLLCTTAALPAPTALAAGSPGPYGFAPDATSVTGAPTPAGAKPLIAGTTYRSSLPGDGPVHYSLDLDATSDTYVSATAAPDPGSTVSAGEGIKVTVQDAAGRSCSFDTETFGVVRSARPIAAWGAREISADRPRCKTAGTYHVVVERVGTPVSAPDDWDLELFVVSEPALRKPVAAEVPEAWNSQTPRPATGDAIPREGGSGFASAVPVGPGVWTSRIEPGGTLFYRVPVGWGGQLSATAELGATDSRGGYTTGALSLELYNPARGFVDDVAANYAGRRREAASLPPLPPVAYENRYAGPDRLGAMRFAGSYYLVVHLASEVAEKFGDGPFDVALRVRVDGSEKSAPDYAGESRPDDVFEAAPVDLDLGEVTGGASSGGTAGGGGSGRGDAAMTVLAVSGIGTGTALLGVLGVWSVVARRRLGGS
ncbi:hypothetical protein ACFW24_28720 [Streptomyces nigra]|uniref:hypothetical protein n=1 Tax=Streptomyces nigra TaxID=1827580 RepID=UPI0036846B79